MQPTSPLINTNQASNAHHSDTKTQAASYQQLPNAHEISPDLESGRTQRQAGRPKYYLQLSGEGPSCAYCWTAGILFSVGFVAFMGGYFTYHFSETSPNIEIGKGSMLASAGLLGAALLCSLCSCCTTDPRSCRIYLS